MKTEQLISINVQLTALKPVAEVFAAVVNPVPYFAESVSGPLAEGKTTQLKFPEMQTQVPIKVTKVVPNKLIRFEWGSSAGGNNTCEFVFSKPQDHNPQAKVETDATTISVTESGWPDNEEGRKSSNGNTMGWTHMLCSLKAYLEYGVNLRKGSFLHMKF